MGNKKISELPVTTELTNTDVIPLVNTSGTQKATITTLQAKIKAFFGLPDNVNTALAAKADQITTYTKTETDDLLDDKVDKTDNTLTTTSKQVVGAINELDGNAKNLGLTVVDGKIAIQYEEE